MYKQKEEETLYNKRKIKSMNENYKDHNENPSLYLLKHFQKHLKCEKCPSFDRKNKLQSFHPFLKGH